VLFRSLGVVDPVNGVDNTIMWWNIWCRNKVKRPNNAQSLSDMINAARQEYCAQHGGFWTPYTSHTGKTYYYCDYTPPVTTLSQPMEDLSALGYTWDDANGCWIDMNEYLEDGVTPNPNYGQCVR
jgi:putative hemolysin